jgi:hypothetical protein
MSEQPVVKKITVTENGKSQDVVIGMTQTEANDRSFVDYMIEAQTEKTKDSLRKQPVKEINPVKREELAGQLKEMQEYRRRKSESVNRRYF